MLRTVSTTCPSRRSLVVVYPIQKGTRRSNGSILFLLHTRQTTLVCTPIACSPIAKLLNQPWSVLTAAVPLPPELLAAGLLLPLPAGVPAQRPPLPACELLSQLLAWPCAASTAPLSMRPLEAAPQLSLPASHAATLKAPGDSCLASHSAAAYGIGVPFRTDQCFAHMIRHTQHADLHVACLVSPYLHEGAVAACFMLHISRPQLLLLVAHLFGT